MNANDIHVALESAVDEIGLAAVLEELRMVIEGMPEEFQGFANDIEDLHEEALRLEQEL